MVDQILPMTLENAVVRKRGNTIVGPVSTTLGKSGFTIVMGANGSGKTSLLRLMNGLERLAEGRISWSCDTHYARRQQAFVFQMPIMLRRSVLANVMYPLTLNGVPKAEAAAQARNWIDRVGLSEIAGLKAAQLSGGEKQKLAIVRALITKPQLLILDEPTTNLDGRAMREIETILRNTNQQGTRIIMSTHDFGQARRLADDVIFLYRGKIHEQRKAAEFFEHPTTAQAAAFLRGDIVE